MSRHVNTCHGYLQSNEQTGGTQWNQLQWRVKLERSVVANSAAWRELYQQVKLGRFAIRSGGFRGTQIVPDLWPGILIFMQITNFYGHGNRIINLPFFKYINNVSIFFNIIFIRTRILQILYTSTTECTGRITAIW